MWLVFAREALLSEVYTLTPKDFPRVIRTNHPWFIDFFAPWCSPCMKFLPHWRKASQNFGRLVNFATVDCSIHVDLCLQYQSYPTALLYNQSRPYKFETFLSQEQIKDFIEEILNPAVVSLNIATFESLVKYKSSNEVWVIEFFSPWCAPCQQIAPHWRKLGKLFNRTSSIHIGEVDCQAYYALCHAVGITSYPTIRLYPKGDKGLERYFTYSGWSRDTMSLHAWIFNFLPSKVKTLTPSTYNATLADSSPWLIDYYAPWCEHCQIFAPEFQRVAELVYDEVKFGQVNCEQLPTLCKSASIRAYPTVMFYSGTKDHPQNPIGIEVQTLTYDGVKEFLEETLKIKFQDSDVRDEL
ncbi:dnaJ homolog subfamily C member 10 [Caerostris extrusa]|uniref:DnaJ homolog subfamily C member 10 n=1 Tax=Caerostris extrusa TaxID=172846 RepID=A0AAV4TRB9_CAEEX|nr:dnaJ homolog subfamily C member 10 [Caerostris extrusa]